MGDTLNLPAALQLRRNLKYCAACGEFEGLRSVDFANEDQVAADPVAWVLILSAVVRDTC